MTTICHFSCKPDRDKRQESCTAVFVHSVKVLKKFFIIARFCATLGLFPSFIRGEVLCEEC